MRSGTFTSDSFGPLTVLTRAYVAMCDFFPILSYLVQLASVYLFIHLLKTLYKQINIQDLTITNRKPRTKNRYLYTLLYLHYKHYFTAKAAREKEKQRKRQQRKSGKDGAAVVSSSTSDQQDNENDDEEEEEDLAGEDGIITADEVPVIRLVYFL